MVDAALAVVMPDWILTVNEIGELLSSLDGAVS
jgi:hypothetical protein